MEISLLRDVIAELSVIKWLLIGNLIGIAFLVLIFFQIVRVITALANDESMQSNRFKREAQDKYDRGRYKQLQGLCERRLKQHAQDKWAHYYLGLAFLRQEKYADAKAHFTRVRELDPQWGESVIEYLDEIHEQLSKNRPTGV